jgi:ADP-ribose pyrophosphatase YjhB (NUDIX family)
MEKTEEKILNLFVYNDKLRFSEIEKQVKIRSNKLSYYLKKLIKENVLKKDGEFYFLNRESEYLIPYIDSKISVLPVILIAITKGDKVFLYKRGKRPYKNKLSLPGGRMVVGEDIKNGVKRIMKKYGINARLKKVNSISLEQVKKNKRIIHSFLLIFVTSATKDNIEYTNVKGNIDDIIQSDYYLIKNDINKEIKIKNISSKI